MRQGEYDRIASIQATHWWYESRRRIVRHLLRRHVGKANNLTILEIGCGSGGSFELLSEFGSVYGTDKHPKAIAISSKSTIPKEVKSATLPNNFPFPDKQFDIICAFDVLEHIKDDAGTLATLAKHLKPGGILCFTVPAHPFLWSKHDVMNHHFRRYTYKKLRQKITDSSLKISYLSYYNVILFPAVATIRILQHLTPLKKKRIGNSAINSCLNRILLQLFSIEKHLIGRLRLPFGISLIGIAQKPPAG